MLTKTELQAKTVAELRAYGADNGIKFNTRIRKPEMIERLAELATEEAPKAEEAPAPAESAFEDGSKVSNTEVKIQKTSGGVVHAGVKRVYTSPEGETSTAYSAPCGAGTQYSITNKVVNNAPFKEVSSEQPTTCKSCIKRLNKQLDELKAKEEAEQAELNAQTKAAAKASKEARKAKAPKEETGKKAEKFLPAAPEPKEPGKKKEAKKEDTPSQSKARLFVRELHEVAPEWATEVTRHDPAVTEVTATRGDESIKIHWLNGRFENGFAEYTDALGRTISMRNRSACLKQAAISEEAALTTAKAKRDSRKNRKVSRSGRPKNAPQAEEVPQEELPFDPEESTAKEIIAAVEGKRITWVNVTSGKVQTALVKPSKQNKVLPGNTKSPSPIIQFTTESGTCAVRISSIKSVR